MSAANFPDNRNDHFYDDAEQNLLHEPDYDVTLPSVNRLLLSADRQDLIGTDDNDSIDINDYAFWQLRFDPALLRRIFARGGNDFVRGGNRNDNIWGGTGNDTLAGSGGDDRLYGEDGDDELYGDSGDDLLDGGYGNDYLQGQDGSDTLRGGAGRDELSGGNGNDYMDGGSDDDYLSGGAGNDQMWGGAGNDTLLGGLDDDQLWGGPGNDELQGDEGDDQLAGDGGNDWLYGGAGNDALYGGSGDDLLIGGTGDDYLDGGDGADDLKGGLGNDTYAVDQYDDMITEYADEGNDTVISSINYLLDANVEQLVLREGYRINATGNSLDNRLVGNAQDNALDGVTGADTMIGGAGNDTYYVDNVDDLVIEQVGGGHDTVKSRISYTLGANLENLTLLDFSKGQKSIAAYSDTPGTLVYGYPTAFELDYTQGNAVAGYRGTCALTAIANLSTLAGRPLSEEQVVHRAIDYGWALSDPGVSDSWRGSSNHLGQQALLKSFGIRNGIVHGYNEKKLAMLIKRGHGVIISVNAGKLWDDPAYLADGRINHVVTLTGVACDAATGTVTGFYIADSGRGKVADTLRYVSAARLRAYADVDGAYAIYSMQAIRLWDERINATGNALNNILTGNRGDNVLIGGKGNDRLIGQAGDDTYVFARGDGRDTIIDNDATSGNTDVLKLLNLAQENLWFEHLGNDLRIKVLGSADQILIRNWYVPGRSGSDNQIEQIRTADGLTLYNHDVDRLVQAMAAFVPPAAGQTRWSDALVRNEPVLLAAAH